MKSQHFPKLSSPAILSPMAGVTDVAFRTLAKRYGAGLTCTEFLSSTALARGSKKTQEMLITDPSEKPVAVQLFGNNIKDIVTAAQYVEGTFDIIDVNCGCPAWKVIKTGAGSALLKNPKEIASFVQKLTSAVNVPVTVKIRSGIDEKHINAVEVAQVVEDAGAAAIAVHGRTQKQGYSGVADWNIIQKVKEAVSIPVIGNGDVFSPEQCKQRLEETNVDAVMIARAAMNNPYIFQQINDFLKKGTYETKEKLALFREYLVLAEQYHIHFPLVKNHALSFSKGLVGGAALRREIVAAQNSKQLKKIMQEKMKT